MRRVAVALVIALIASPAFAGGVKTKVNNSAGAASLSANEQNITFNSPAIPKTTTTNFRNNPDISAPGLTTTFSDTCMGSSSGGGSGGGVGITIGTTWRDDSCVHRLNSARLESMGMKRVAYNIMCLEEDVYWGARESQYPCPRDQKFENSYDKRFGVDATKEITFANGWAFPDGGR